MAFLEKHTINNSKLLAGGLEMEMKKHERLAQLLGYL